MSKFKYFFRVNRFTNKIVKYYGRMSNDGGAFVYYNRHGTKIVLRQLDTLYDNIDDVKLLLIKYKDAQIDVCLKDIDLAFRKIQEFRTMIEKIDNIELEEVINSVHQ